MHWLEVSALIASNVVTFDRALLILGLLAQFGVFGILLQQHKVFVRMKDRLNTLWFRHCQDTGDRFEPLDNGK